MTSGRRSVALITGAAGGLGAGAAERLVSDGWAVLLFDRNPDVAKTARRLEDVSASGGTAWSHVGDVATAADLEAAVDRLRSEFGGIDLAVANAGIAREGVDLCDVSDDDFMHVMTVDLFGVYLTCRVAGRPMREQRSGCIITTSSIFGVEPVRGAAAYCASKAGVIALTKTLALEMAPYGVRVNSIAPGYMRTEMQWAAIRQKAEASGASFQDERQKVVDGLPLARHGEPDDFAGAVAFLASDDASYITGHNLGVTGGVVRW